MHDVSVIIPAYQAEKTIGRALESVLAQTMRPKEVIVIDDGSLDETLKIACSFEGKVEGVEVRVVTQKNCGAGAARNHGVSLAKGNLVAFLDSDDEWLNRKIEQTILFMEETGADLVAHDYILVNDGSEQEISCSRHFKGHFNPYLSLYLRGNLATSTVIVSREKLMDAGGFDTSLLSGQDIDLWLKILSLENVTFHIFGESLTRYYVTKNSISTRIGERRRCARIILLRHIDNLRIKSNFAKFYAVIRSFIVFYQAASSYWAQGQSYSCVLTIVYMPFSLVRVLVEIYAIELAWFWLVFIILIYCAQFLPYLNPILRLLNTIGACC